MPSLAENRHDNFLTGTFPASLGRLHWLRELQLSHNQVGKKRDLAGRPRN